MAITTNAPIPRAAFVEPVISDVTGQQELKLTFPASVFLRTMRTDIDAAPRAATVAPVTQVGQNASIVTTDILTPSVDGLYAFQFYAEVATADAVSSSLTPVLGWTAGGVAKSKTFTAMAGNTITTSASEVYMILADANAPITYALTYASNTPGSMVYNFYAVTSSVSGV